MQREQHSSVYLPPPAPGPSLGCFAKGCLTVAVVGVVLTMLFGCIGWYVARALEPYLSQQPVQRSADTPLQKHNTKTLESKIKRLCPDGKQKDTTPPSPSRPTN